MWRPMSDAQLQAVLNGYWSPDMRIAAHGGYEWHDASADLADFSPSNDEQSFRIHQDKYRDEYR